MAEFTGERVIPGQVDADLLNEHMARYAFAARLSRRKQVLDAGCGSGYGSAELAKAAAGVLGIDRSAEANGIYLTVIVLTKRRDISRTIQ